MPHRSNFFGNACMFFGSLQRGLILKTPHVTFPLSKVGLHMAKLLSSIGVIDSYRVVQNHGRIGHSNYVALPDDADVTSTSDLFRCPHLYLHLTYSTQPFRPLAPPASGNTLHSPIPYTDKLPTSITVISKPTRKIFYNKRELQTMKRRFGPGIMLLSTRKGVITDIEAEAYGFMGGIPLGHIGLPLGHVAKLRAIVRQKQQQEQQQQEAQQEAQQADKPFVSLADWPVRQMMAAAAEKRELELQRRQAEQLPLVETLAAERRAKQIDAVADASDAIMLLKKQLLAGQTADSLKTEGPGGRDVRPMIRRNPRAYLHRDEQSQQVLDEIHYIDKQLERKGRERADRAERAAGRGERRGWQQFVK